MGKQSRSGIATTIEEIVRTGFWLNNDCTCSNDQMSTISGRNKTMPPAKKTQTCDVFDEPCLFKDHFRPGTHTNSDDVNELAEFFCISPCKYKRGLERKRQKHLFL